MAHVRAYVPNLRQHRALLSLTLEEVAAELARLRNRQILWIAGESMITRRPC
jgi:hypothetical protein